MATGGDHEGKAHRPQGDSDGRAGRDPTKGLGERSGGQEEETAGRDDEEAEETESSIDEHGARDFGASTTTKAGGSQGFEEISTDTSDGDEIEEAAEESESDRIG